MITIPAATTKAGTHARRSWFRRALLAAAVASVLVPRPALAQGEDGPVSAATPAPALTTPAPALKGPAYGKVEQPEVRGGNVLVRFGQDVAGDYVHFFSWDTALVLGIGGGAALAVHPADETLHEKAVNGDLPKLGGGAEWGSQYLQFPLAAGWWAVAAAAGSSRHADTGRDMLRAQIAAFSWAYAIKYATDRTRPNGDPRSFPSGHATTAFATASVLHEHYGWKVGVPAFAVASYTALERVTNNYHWLSDVVFGAAVGIACGRTATIHVRGTPLKIQPAAVPGGAAIQFTTTRSSS